MDQIAVIKIRIVVVLPVRSHKKNYQFVQFCYV